MAEKVEEVAKLFHEFKSGNEAQIKAIEAGNTALAKEIDAKLIKINERMDAAETKLSRPVVNHEPATDEEADLRKAQSKAFRVLAKGGARALNPEQEKALQTRYVTIDGVKALATDNLTSGGYFMPINVSNRVLELLLEMSPLRSLATVESISSGDAYEQPKEGTTAFTAGWVGERGSRAETTAGTFEMDKIPVHESYANPFVTQKMLDDPSFNIEMWVANKVGKRFAKLESTAFIVGTGVGAPLGILSTLPGSTAIETIEGASSLTVETDDLLSLEAALPEEYAKNGSYLMRRATKFIVRKLKGGDGHYLWQPSLQVGTPPTFDGKPVHEGIDMPVATSSGNKAIIFGDFRSAYVIVDRQGVRTQPDPFSSKPYVEMYSTYRVGGQCVLPEAVKILTIKA